MPASRTLEKTNTPGVYRRGGKYVVVYRDPQGRQRKRAADTIAAAKDIKASVRTDISRGEFRELSRATLNEYAPSWIDSYLGRTRSGCGENTRSDYRDALERDILPALGRFRLAEIEPGDIKALAKRLTDRGIAPASVTKTMAPLKALLATAVEERLIRSNPSAGIRLAQPLPDTGDEPEAVKALTDAEYELLAAQLPEAWRPFFSFLGETGLRISEAIELRYGDIDGRGSSGTAGTPSRYSDSWDTRTPASRFAPTFTCSTRISRGPTSGATRGQHKQPKRAEVPSP